MIDLSLLPIESDGSVPGLWRIRLYDNADHGFAGASFIGGVAENVPGTAMRRLVAAIGPQMKRIERMDVVETPLISAAKPDPAPQPNAKAKRGRK